MEAENDERLSERKLIKGSPEVRIDREGREDQNGVHLEAGEQVGREFDGVAAAEPLFRPTSPTTKVSFETRRSAVRSIGHPLLFLFPLQLKRPWPAQLPPAELNNRVSIWINSKYKY